MHSSRDSSTTAAPSVFATVPGEVALDQHFDGGDLYRLRSAVAAHATALGAAATQTEDLLIVAGELVTNAIRHGDGSGRLRLWRTGDALVCRVEDHGDGIVETDPGVHRPPITGAGGRGLWIVRQLADHVIIADTREGAVVTAVVPLAAAKDTAAEDTVAEDTAARDTAAKDTASDSPGAGDDDSSSSSSL